MYKCPHCGQPGILWLSKMFLGPIRPTTCCACGQKVGVSWKSMFPVILIVVVLPAVFLNSPSPYIRAASLITATVLATCAVSFWCPLERR